MTSRQWHLGPADSSLLLRQCEALAGAYGQRPQELLHSVSDSLTVHQVAKRAWYSRQSDQLTLQMAHSEVGLFDVPTLLQVLHWPLVRLQVR